jgi:toxin ParE1/3/4
MSRYIITPDAEADLEHIGDYIAQDSARQAEKFLDRLAKEFERLADMPRMGRSRPELTTETRLLPFRP